MLIRIRWTATDLFGLATNTCAGQLRVLSPWIGGAYLKNVETLVLHHLAIIAQQLHAKLEILPALHISHHYVVVRTVQQNLP